MQTLYGQRTWYFYKQTSHSTCQVGQLQVRQHHRMSGTKLFSMTAAQTMQAVRRRRKTKIQWDVRNQQYTEDVHDDDAETEAPQQQTHEETPEQMPEQTPKQSGAPADDARADDTIVVPLTAEEMVILTSGDEEPAAEQEENQPPGPVEVFSIGLNEQQTPVSCKWGLFLFPSDHTVIIYLRIC